jgi:antitoxin ParD1/3/4
MGAVRKISIALTEQLAADVDRAVESGQYASTSEVIRDALRAWSQDRERRIAELRRLISEADASGPPIEGNFDYEDIIRRGRERLAPERSPG